MEQFDFTIRHGEALANIANMRREAGIASLIVFLAAAYQQIPKIATAALLKLASMVHTSTIIDDSDFQGETIPEMSKPR